MAEYDITQFSEAGLDTAAGIGFTGNEEKYFSAVQRFVKNFEKNRTKIQEYHAAKDYESYAITVHALKSNSRMIGAGELGLLFEELETAAKKGDTVTIEGKTISALSAYAELAGKLEPLAGQSEIHAEEEITAEEARKTLDELLAALDDFDDELSKKLVLKLGCYPFGSPQRDKLARALKCIEDYRYEDAEELIRELSTDR